MNDQGAKTSKRALEGVKALGFTYAGTANIVLRNIGMNGATVVRVESSKRPCNLRVAQPYKDGIPGLNRSGYFALYNNDRYSLALDLKHPGASPIVKKLVEWTDILVENFSPGTVERLGLDYEHVKKINPEIIMLSISQQGQTGPHSFMPGYGGTLQGLGGISGLTGWPDRWPVLVDQSYPDFIAPRFAVVALLAALDYRRRTGKGQYIDCSNYENCIHFMTPVVLDYTMNKRNWGLQGNDRGDAAPHGAFRCKGEDKWCVISISSDREWCAFCEVIGRPEWAGDSRFCTLQARRRNREELGKMIIGWTEERTAHQVMTLLQGAGIASGVVQNCEDLFKDPQVSHRNYFKTLDHREMGEHPYLSTSYLLSDTSPDLRSSAPLLGEHNEFVLKELLGMSEEEYVEALLSELLT
jgi:benzylsuccinate CoA-transferase BbsF subunit